MIIRRVAILLCAVVLLSPYVTAGDGNEEEPLQQLTLRVGAQDDLKMTSMLGATDIWTSNVLSPVYGTVGLEDPATQGPLPYLLKGVDADDDGDVTLTTTCTSKSTWTTMCTTTCTRAKT